MGVIGEAFVRVRPETTGFEHEAGGAISGALNKLGPLGAPLAVVSVAAIGVIGALAGIGEEFQKATNTIRTQTGATGPVLAGLKNDMKAVFSDIPTTVDAAANAIATLSQRTGLAGKPLQDLAKEQLNLARITKQDLGASMESTQKAMANFGIAAAQQGPKLDELYRAAQRTGITVPTLAAEMQKAGPILRTLGFNFEQSAGLLAQLNKQGIDSGPIIAGLRKAIQSFSKDAAGGAAATKALATEQKAADSTAATLATAQQKLADLIAVQSTKAKLSVGDNIALRNAHDAVTQATAAHASAADKLAAAHRGVTSSLTPAERLKAVFDAIKNAATPMEATSLALKTFGARAGPQLADAIRGGKLEFQAFADALGKGDSINKAAEDTLTLHQRLTILKNQAFAALEPVATRTLQLIEKGFEKVVEGVKIFFEVLAEVKTVFVEAFALGGNPFGQVSSDLSGFEAVIVRVARYFRIEFDSIRTVFSEVAKFFSAHKAEIIGAITAIGVVIIGGLVPFLITLTAAYYASAAAAVASAVAAAAAWIVAAAPFIAIGLAVAAVGAAVVYAYQHFEVFRTVVDKVAQFLKATFSVAVQVLIVAFNVLVVIVKVAIAAIGAAFSFLTGTVLPIAETFGSGVVGVFSKVADFVGRWASIFGSAISTAFGAVVRAVSAVAGPIIAEVTKIFDGVKAFFDSISGPLGEAAGHIFVVIRTVITIELNVIKTIITVEFTIIKAIVTTALAVLSAVWSVTWNTMKAVLGPILTIIKTVIGVEFTAIHAVITAVLTVVSAVWNATFSSMRDIVVTIFDAIQTVIATVVGVIEGIIRTALDLINGDWGKAWDQIKTTVSTVLNGIQTLVNDALRILLDLFTAGIAAIGAAVSSGFGAVLTFFTTVGSKILGAIGDLSRLLFNVGVAILRGLYDGAVSLIGLINDFFGGLPLAFLNAIGDIAGLFYRLGGSIIHGLLDGMKAAFNAIVGFFTGLGSSIFDAVKSGLGALAHFLSPKTEFGVALGNGIVLGMQHAIDTNGHIVTAAASRLRDKVDKATQGKAGRPTPADGSGSESDGSDVDDDSGTSSPPPGTAIVTSTSGGDDDGGRIDAPRRPGGGEGSAGISAPSRGDVESRQGHVHVAEGAVQLSIVVPANVTDLVAIGAEVQKHVGVAMRDLVVAIRARDSGH